MRKRFVFRGGKLIEKEAQPSLEVAPMVQTDSMDAAVHPATGRVYESKSAFRRETQAAGCVEVGNDWNGSGPSQLKSTFDRNALRDCFAAAKDKHR